MVNLQQYFYILNWQKKGMLLHRNKSSRVLVQIILFLFLKNKEVEKRNKVCERERVEEGGMGEKRRTRDVM
jgi:hypothetical protein